MWRCDWRLRLYHNCVLKEARTLNQSSKGQEKFTLPPRLCLCLFLCRSFVIVVTAAQSFPRSFLVFVLLAIEDWGRIELFLWGWKWTCTSTIICLQKLFQPWDGATWMRKTHKSILGSPSIGYLFVSKRGLEATLGRRIEKSARNDSGNVKFPIDAASHRQVICRQSSATCCQNSLRYSQVATVVWWSVPYTFSGFFSLLMKWNGQL